MFECLKNGTDFIGTLRGNSDLFHKDKFIQTPSIRSHLFKNKYLTYVQYRNSFSSKKDVVVVTTLKKDVSLVRADGGKPTTILDYNKLKGGVDVVDRMVEHYSCSRPTRRWPMALFYHLLSIAVRNSFIIYSHSNSISFECFINNLCKELIKEYVGYRIEMKRVKRSDLYIMKQFGLINNENNTNDSKKGRCLECESERRNDEKREEK